MKTPYHLTLAAVMLCVIGNAATLHAALVVTNVSLTGQAIAYTSLGNSGSPLNETPTGEHNYILSAIYLTSGFASAGLDLTTSIQPTAFSLTSMGSSSAASSSGFIAGALAFATLEVTFTVTEPMLSSVSLAGLAGNLPNTVTGTGLSSQLLENGAYVVDLSIDSFAGGTGPGVENFLLIPGPTYVFSTSALINAEALTTSNPSTSQSGNLSGTGSFAVIPEPGSVALLALGGLLLLRRRNGQA